MRSGASGRHSLGSKARAASGAVAASSSTKTARGQRRCHVGERGGAVALVDEAEAGQAPRRGDDDRLAERRGVEAIGEAQPFAPIVARRQRLVGDEEVVQPARAGKTDVVGGVEHAGGVTQQFPRALDGDRLQERLRRQPRPALEDVLKVRGREADVRGDGLDRGLVAPARRNEFDRISDRGVVGAGIDGNVGHVEHDVCPMRISPIVRICARRATRKRRRRRFTSRRRRRSSPIRAAAWRPARRPGDRRRDRAPQGANRRSRAMR